MSTRKIASVAFTGAAAMATVGFGTQAANAAPASAWHITPPGHFHGTNVGTTVLVDKTQNITLTCTHAEGSGSLSGDGKTSVPAQLGTFTAAPFGNANSPCSFNGILFTANINKNLALWGDTPTDANGVTKGHIGGNANSISATLTGLSIGCDATVVGTSLPGSFHNTSNHLVINPNSVATLSVKRVDPANNCLGLIHSGDQAYFKAVYQPDNPTTITYGP